MSAAPDTVAELMRLADEHASEIALSYEYPPPPVSCDPAKTREALESHACIMAARITQLEAENAELLAILQLVDVELGVDGHGADLEDGECSTIDKVRAVRAKYKATGSAS